MITSSKQKLWFDNSRSRKTAIFTKIFLFLRNYTTVIFLKSLCSNDKMGPLALKCKCPCQKHYLNLNLIRSLIFYFRKILKLVDYLPLQTDKLWYNYYQNCIYTSVTECDMASFYTCLFKVVLIKSHNACVYIG